MKDGGTSPETLYANDTSEWQDLKALFNKTEDAEERKTNALSSRHNHTR